MTKKLEVIAVSAPITLPYTGKSRWSGFKLFSPVCHGTFLALSKQGKAPKAERLGSRCTFYDNQELHKWLSNPIGYRAGE